MEEDDPSSLRSQITPPFLALNLDFRVFRFHFYSRLHSYRIREFAVHSSSMQLSVQSILSSKINKIRVDDLLSCWLTSCVRNLPMRTKTISCDVDRVLRSFKKSSLFVQLDHSLNTAHLDILTNFTVDRD